MQQYEVRDTWPDSCTVAANAALSSMRCFAVELQQARQDEVVPGSMVVADETMVGWGGATNIHITKFPTKS
jgi:hypothetical protein